MKQDHGTIWGMVKSVAAALFGVQSQQNHHQDFKHSSPWPFIIIGTIAILLLVITLIAIAQQATAT